MPKVRTTVSKHPRIAPPSSEKVARLQTRLIPYDHSNERDRNAQKEAIKRAVKNINAECDKISRLGGDTFLVCHASEITGSVTIRTYPLEGPTAPFFPTGLKEAIAKSLNEALEYNPINKW